MNQNHATSEPNYYELLGLERDASDAQIHNAYRIYSAMCHPKQTHYYPQQLPIQTLTKEGYWYLLNEAYDVLMNPQHRLTFDLYGKQGLKGGVDLPDRPVQPYAFDGDCARVYNQYLARNSWNATSQQTVAANAVAHATTLTPLMTIGVTLEELFFGTAKLIVYRRLITVNGRTHEVEQPLTLYIARGTFHGAQLVHRGLGNIVDGVCGDAVFLVLQVQHPRFGVRGVDLSLMSTVSWRTMLLGGPIEFFGIDGRRYTYRLPANFRPGDSVALSGAGMPVPNTTLRGDLVVNFAITLPVDIPRHVRNLIAGLLDSCY